MTQYRPHPLGFLQLDEGRGKGAPDRKSFEFKKNYLFLHSEAPLQINFLLSIAVLLLITCNVVSYILL
ncbi:MAG: hypothetical protein A3K90_08215 [Pelodictyon luteolum]|uniref:Uncharacterized protein n=1 Tax=Pelodictyon luteolum TaxID=1100 RepID=A0A165L5I6_PELLU|nr:MAG: hypothetical protein A3K90_08215 [Pelodictyon luteolum]